MVEELKLTEINLEGEIADRSSEISGMCWFGNKLLILPQYPNNFSKDRGKIFFIEKSDILSAINHNVDKPIIPDFFSIDLTGFEDLFQIGSGFESVALKENIAYFTIEHMNNGKTETILVKGFVDSLKKEITLDKSTLTNDPADLFIHNISDESILVHNETIIPIYEVFGKNINKNPRVSLFDLDLDFIKKISFPNIEYRITDVTSVDNENKFWAINYFYPGDYRKLNPAKDQFFQKFGIGKTHANNNVVERLVEFEITESEITFSKRQPIYIELEPNVSRNWEALVKLDNLGFLVATDTFPKTILAFIPFNLD